MKILPEQDEIELLKSWEGDHKKLGNAEQFVLHLISVKNYRLRVEGMLLKAEFEANMSFLEPSIEAMLSMGEELMASQKLQNLLYMVLVAGNFLNSGGYAGNAAGMKISSLHKLTDIRSNKPGMNMLHYVAGQVEQTQPDLLTLVDDLSLLEEACKTSIEALNSDISKLDTQIKKISQQMENPNTEPDVKEQMQEFLPYASKELECLQTAMEDLNKLQTDLAEFFCEDSKTFRIEECFKAFHQFIAAYKKAIGDNEQRHEQERVAEQRRLQREAEQAKRRSGSFQGAQKDDGDGDADDEVVMNNLMHDIKEGFIQRRLPDGGFKQQYSPMVMRKFKKSLDSQMSQNSTVSNLTTQSSRDSEEDSSLQAGQVPAPQTPYGTPKTGRRGRGGSFSGPNQQAAGDPLLLNGDLPGSPGMRRRRSRVPSEEDDKLINFLVAGGHDGSRERNISIGNVNSLPRNLGEQGNYGSLDRGLLRRSRGRKRPEQEESNREKSAPQAAQVEEEKITEDPKTKEIKKRVESWLKDSEEDTKKAEEYLDKKRDIKTYRGSNSDLKNSKGLGTLHEDKPMDANTIVSNTDVISAMEAIEGASQDKQPRKKTPPSHEDVKKKALIRSLGRKPSDDRVSLYVRKPSNETKPLSSNTNASETESVKIRDKKPATDDSKKTKFLQEMARRSLEIPTDFLDKIDEEKKALIAESDSKKASPLEGVTDKKYPFKRTTTPNTLREHLKETLTRNLGSSTDLAQTIHAIKDDEILDTFNIDSENIETPPIQRRAFRHKSFKSPEQQEDKESEIGSDFSGRRKNHKFKTITGDGRPLGDRELVLKKKKASNNDLSIEGTKKSPDLEDELGAGLFDRFSNARKTLTRGSTRKKKDEDTLSLQGELMGDSKTDGNWRSKLASRFRKSNADQYDLEEAERREAENDDPATLLRRALEEDYLGQPAPMTEPPRRKPLNIEDNNKKLDGNESKRISNTLAAKKAERRDRTKSRIEKDQVDAAKKSNGMTSKDRKSSYIMPGDYDSELVDGKYVTSVPIISIEQAENPANGNIRPGHSLKNLKKAEPRKTSIMERLSRSSSAREPTGRPTAGGPTAGGTVFDRLSNGKSNSKLNLNSTGNSTRNLSASNTSLRGVPSRATSLPPEKPRGTLNKIKDLSKDISRNLRKGKDESLSNSSSYLTSRTTRSGVERKPMSNLNGGSHPSINSSTRSLHKTISNGTGVNKPLSTLDVRSKNPIVKIKTSTSVSSLRNPASHAISASRNATNSSGRPNSSKENLSRSSSSASRSSVTNSMSRNGSIKTGPSHTLSSSNKRSNGFVPSSISSGTTNTFPKAKPSSGSSRSTPSFMKPTTATAKKVLGPGNSVSSNNQTPVVRKASGKLSNSSTTTTSRVTPVAPRPSRH